MLKVFKRYTVVSVLIVLCFFSAFISLCNGLLSVAQADKLIRRENQYACASEIQATIHVAEDMTPDTLLRLMDHIRTCNVYLENMEIYFDEIDSVYRPNVVLCQNEKLSLPTDRPDLEIPEGSVIAPSSTTGGRGQLSIHGQEFSVYDTMDDDAYPFVSGLFVLNANDYFKAFPEALHGLYEITLRITSNEDDAYAAFAQIRTNLQEEVPKAAIHATETAESDNIFQILLSEENLFSADLFLFALINTLIISYYWITVRRREIAIRKAFGADNRSVIRLVSGELLQLIGLAALAAIVVQGLIWLTRGNSLDVREALLIAGGLLLSIAIAVMIAMAVPIHFILRIQPSEGVER